MASHHNIDFKKLLADLKKSDQKAFRTIYDLYYKYLVVTIYNISGDNAHARDMAQEALLELWKRRETIHIKSSLKSYLRRTVINKNLNHIAANKRMDFSAPEDLPERTSPETSTQEQLEAEDLKAVIHRTIASLPPKCRLVFTLSRLEHFSHKQIAQQLNISVKTVENQMTKALKKLRASVANFQKNELVWWLGMLFTHFFL